MKLDARTRNVRLSSPLIKLYNNEKALDIQLVTNYLSDYYFHY